MVSSRLGALFVALLLAATGESQPDGQPAPLRFDRVTQETGFGGTTLRIAVHVEKPFVFFDNTKTGNARFSGITIELIQLMSQDLDFQYTLTIDESSPENVEKALQAIGMDVDPSEITADVAAGVVHITNDRINDVHFSQAFFDTGYIVVVPRPKVSADLWAFLSPFSLDLWMFVVIEMVIVALLFFIMEAPAFTVQEGGDSDLVDGVQWSLIDSLYWSVSALTCTLDKAPRTWGGKMVMLAHGWFFLIIIASYTANLASDLTATGLAPTITGWNDVTSQGKGVKLAVPRGLAHEAFLAFETKHHGFQFDADLYDRWEQAMDAAALGTNGAAATFHDYAIVQYYLADTLQKRPTFDERCGLMQVGSTFAPVGYGFAFPLNSAAFIAFSQSIIKFKEEGEIAKLVHKYGVGAKAEAAIAALCPLNTSTRLYFRDFHGLSIMTGIIAGAALLVCLLSKAACDKNKPHDDTPAPAAPGKSEAEVEQAVQAALQAAMGDAAASASPAVQGYRAALETGLRAGLKQMANTPVTNGYGSGYDTGQIAWVHTSPTPYSSMPPQYAQPPNYNMSSYNGSMPMSWGEG